MLVTFTNELLSELEKQYKNNKELPFKSMAVYVAQYDTVKKEFTVHINNLIDGSALGIELVSLDNVNKDTLLDEISGMVPKLKRAFIQMLSSTREILNITLTELVHKLIITEDLELELMFNTYTNMGESNTDFIAFLSQYTYICDIYGKKFALAFIAEMLYSR